MNNGWAYKVNLHVELNNLLHHEEIIWKDNSHLKGAHLLLETKLDSNVNTIKKGVF